MKLSCLLGLFLLSLPLFAQPVFYQVFEVDSAAEPRGGMAYLGTFLQTNLRKPIEAEAKGIGGRVILNAIVEPDGQLTNITVARSLRPDCDQEAIRALSLFRAWKPALKGGKAVRQVVTIPVTYKPNSPFPYINGAKITYYDQKRQLLPDSSELARYKQVLPMNAVGMPTGDLIIYERKRADWK